MSYEEKMAGESELQKMLSGQLYRAWDEQLVNMRTQANVLVDRFNNTKNVQERQLLYPQLLGSFGKKPYIEPPFNCDYGKFISVGDEFYANYGCVILDCSYVTIGDHVMLAPGVHIYAAAHPIDAETRHDKALEFALPIKIGSRVWIGGSSVVNPGIVIGDDVVIGAGSVVTKDIPSGVIAAGNPARIIRKIESPHQEFQRYQLKRDQCKAWPDLKTKFN